MSWDDDDDAGHDGEYRPPRERTRGWRSVRRIAGISGVVVGAVVGAVALVVGVVVAVNLIGTASNPGGFAAPAAYGVRVALPPVETTTDEVSGDDEPSGTALPEEPTGLSSSAVAPLPSVDSEWISDVAAATDIPERALAAYAAAHVVLAEEAPECGVDWTTIAAIGSIESRHGTHGATTLDDNGYADPPIIGPALDGGEDVAEIADTDEGLLDDDTTWDRAVGPMQFIPSTWAKWASDGNGDDVADPNQIDDAALTTARYLCHSGAMTDPEGWRAAVYSYNHDNDYVDKVATVANEYADAAG